LLSLSSGLQARCLLGFIFALEVSILFCGKHGGGVHESTGSRFIEGSIQGG
jgi:hypothetical protein